MSKKISLHKGLPHNSDKKPRKKKIKKLQTKKKILLFY